ncbi:MAG: YIP1 family protein [Desulfobacteraceae bacterium]|nr:MAG: YIP1 family protein [Desulfobacteraceae bacterium]
MNITERIKGILLGPKEEWQTIAGETTPIGDLYKNYIIILAAIGPVASFIGMSLVGFSLPMGGAFRVPITSGIITAVVQYGLTLVGVYILAIIIDALAPTFSGEKNLNQAFKLAMYSCIPGWLVGIFALIPALGVLGILGLYGLYLLYVGLPVLMKSPKEKSTVYTIAVIIAAIIIFVVTGAISRFFIPDIR